jgi:hypothetical protein
MLAPGDKLLAEPVMELYSNFDFKRMMDVEELEFPPDTDTHKSNLTLPVAFNEYVQPRVEKILEEKAEDNLSGRMIRNLSMGGSNIQKETVRAFLGLYRVVYKYGGHEHSMWATGDGQGIWGEELPTDTQRQNAHVAKQAAASVPAKGIGWLIFGIVACTIGALFTAGISLIGAIICGAMIPSARKKAKEHNEQLDQAKADLAAFEAQQPEAARRFRSSKTPLRGIYEGEVAGDAGAF